MLIEFDERRIEEVEVNALKRSTGKTRQESFRTTIRNVTGHMRHGAN